MSERTRTRLIAAAIGATVALVSVGLGFWLGGAFERVPTTDGSFVLDEPGIFEEPSDERNDDVSGATLPDVVLLDEDGREHRLGELLGTPTILNVWFSTCVPCRRELPDFATIDAEFGDRVQIVGVNPFDTPDAMRRFADDRGVAYTLWRDADQELVNELGIVAFPVTLFVDADGTVVRQTGEIDADGLRDAIRELFGVEA